MGIKCFVAWIWKQGIWMVHDEPFASDIEHPNFTSLWRDRWVKRSLNKKLENASGLLIILSHIQEDGILNQHGSTIYMTLSPFETSVIHHVLSGLWLLIEFVAKQSATNRAWPTHRRSCKSLAWHHKSNLLYGQEDARQHKFDNVYEDNLYFIHSPLPHVLLHRSVQVSR